MLTRPVPPDTAWNRALGAAKRAAGELVHLAWETAGEWAAIGPATRRGRRFGAFGDGSVICFPPGTIMNERYIHIGSGTMIGAVRHTLGGHGSRPAMRHRSGGVDR